MLRLKCIISDHRLLAFFFFFFFSFFFFLFPLFSFFLFFQVLSTIHTNFIFTFLSPSPALSLSFFVHNVFSLFDHGHVYVFLISVSVCSALYPHVITVVASSLLVDL